jgi:hypothetical protein
MATWNSRSCQVFPIIGTVAFATTKPFAGGLLHSRSVGLTAFAIRKSFSQLPKLLKSLAAQVDNHENYQSNFAGNTGVHVVHKICNVNFSGNAEEGSFEPIKSIFFEDF